MTEIQRSEPSFTELLDYVMGLAEKVDGLNINLLQPLSAEQQAQVLAIIDSSDGRLRAGLDRVIDENLLIDLENSINNNYGDERRGFVALQILRMYTNKSKEPPTDVPNSPQKKTRSWLSRILRGNKLA